MSSIPEPNPTFDGVIAELATGSQPSRPALRLPPAGAPNVVVVLLDDVGFGAPATFGGPVPMPTLDRIAARGLLYNQFHTTALCSPTVLRCSPVATTTAPTWGRSPRSLMASPATTA